MTQRKIPLLVAYLVGCLIATDLSAQSLDEFIDLTYSTLISAADDADVVAWVTRRNGNERVMVASGTEYKPREVIALVGDTGDTIRSITLSPNGHWLAFQRGPIPAPDGRMPNPASLVKPLVDGLWIADLESSEAPELITEEGGSPAFSPQSDQLAFMKAGSLRVIRPGDVELPDPLFDDLGSVSEYAWAPDGKTIALVSARRTSSFVGLFRFNHERIEWLAPSSGRDMCIAWSPDGNRIAYVRLPARNYREPFQVMKGTAFEIWTAEARSGKATRLHSDPDRHLFTQPSFPLSWLADGRVLFLSAADGFSHLYAVDSTTKQLDQLTSGPFEVETVKVNHTGDTILIGSNRADVQRRDIAFWTTQNQTFQQISHKNTVATESVFVGKTSQVAYRSASERQPPTPTISTIDAGSQHRALEQYPAKNMFQEPEPIQFKSADGLELTGTLFRPQGLAVGQKSSAVVYVHGGPPRQMMPAIHRSLYYAYTYAANQYLASQGTTVLAVNYRCGIGFGTKFHSVPKYGPHGAEEFQDIVAAGEYLKALPFVDATRIGIYGGSYGGFLSAYGLARRSDLFAAGAAWHGIYDWSYWTKNPLPSGMFFTPWGVAEEDPEIVRQSSPLAHVETWRSPVLLISGDNDRRVLVEETVAMEQALQRGGVPVETMIIPNEIHSFLRHETWQLALDRTIRFLNSNLE